jgi:hypothetical protein
LMSADYDRTGLIFDVKQDGFYRYAMPERV